MGLLVQLECNYRFIQFSEEVDMVVNLRENSLNH